MLFLLYISIIVAIQFDELRFAFNEGRSVDIYNMLSDESKATIIESDFVAKLDGQREQYGEINYWLEIETDSEYSAIVGFSKQLSVGLMVWSINDTNELLKFTIVDLGTPSLVQFIKENPERVSMTVYENNNVVFDQLGDRLMSLEGIIKIHVTCEFARQASLNLLDLNKRVTLTQLNRFYIKYYDNGHLVFLKTSEKQGKIINNTLSLWDIAEGMIRHRSFCNLEFLQTILGLKNIEDMMNQLGVAGTNSTYFVSSKLAFMNFKNLPFDQYIDSLREMTFEQFVEKQKIIHDHLYDRSAQAEYILENAFMSIGQPEVHEIQVQFYPYSTTNSIASVLQKLNTKYYTQFNDLFYDYIYDLMGIISMASDISIQLFTHAGSVSGQVWARNDQYCVLNKAFYNQYKKEIMNNLSRSIAIFMDQLDYESEYNYLNSEISIFEILISENIDYYNAVMAKLK